MAPTAAGLQSRVARAAATLSLPVPRPPADKPPPPVERLAGWGGMNVRSHRCSRTATFFLPHKDHCLRGLSQADPPFSPDPSLPPSPLPLLLEVQ